MELAELKFRALLNYGIVKYQTTCISMGTPCSSTAASDPFTTLLITTGEKPFPSHHCAGRLRES